ncbi:Mitochondrial-processing peptidase subunit alpha [Yamadazyma tenuis]|uniref:LuxS/MPP-like metallohydrolase n=1 Tax=Candida tenuis (strain ATCC 10573 / BCRC 21748 / CBS 615 / JCM 9827 / NBRC 10315 / NRRL Y-1498 / VKM Y-70) TaxID=590646 RepID=G3B5S5_CANTC|nr:LuxS/MPP-like metallohydrolase [Yamadazyma tenuis ATCC 10573]XP_006687413.1 uncharacterized protein CANTEDRAFT_114590 [Yamadazyma tenuis ATCC 10573]EGV63619.1 LuxS/MPP-like metallohydrolase [Yamadazyma tenuis ATCC 10573]EGV63620.1 hypothetical protein CANTEDRAFT_114590 [Yamadazyma tenuis ATCC 10573]WEJ96889.1 Mitochondrial-processing peptidase subunit alpha [Yamadazyma tenuis]
MLRRYLSTSRSHFNDVVHGNPSINLSTLPNGLRVITDSTPGHFSALGAYIDAGSKFEDPSKPGISHLMDRLAWRSTEKYTGTEMMNALSNLGGNYMCSAQRESMIYQASVFNKDVDKMFDCISQTILEPKFTDKEFLETLSTIDFETSVMVHKPDIVLPELLHKVAYPDNTLGLPLYCPVERIPYISKDEVLNYHKSFYQPQNIVVSMIGVEHAHAIKLVESTFGHLTKGPAHQVPKPKYVGGEIHIPFQPPLFSNLPELYHMQIGFETTGLLNDELYSLAVLQKLLGGGSSFSAGGPGKGMFSRLYTRVLNQYAFIENCTSFNHSYVGSGLFGINISASPNAAHVMPQIIGFEFSSLLEPNAISDSEFNRAKNQLISTLLYNVESKLAALEDLGRQIQCQNKLVSIDEMIEKINALTIKDLTKVVEKLISSNPSVVLQGDREAFGNLDDVFKHFGLNQKRSKWF